MRLKAPPRLLGPILWISCIQFFIVQIVVSRQWPSYARYNWAHNTISDLGNTHCGLYGSKLVCSPLHNTMNISFVVLGVTMILGAFINAAYGKRTTLRQYGYSCIVLAGVGSLLVGLFPENTISTFHILGAAFSFAFGNVAMILLGLSHKNVALALRIYSVFSGSIGLIALVLFLSRQYLGIGEGGMERLTAYPLTLWLIIFGSNLLYRYLLQTNRRSMPPV